MNDVVKAHLEDAEACVNKALMKLAEEHPRDRNLCDRVRDLSSAIYYTRVDMEIEFRNAVRRLLIRWIN